MGKVSARRADGGGGGGGRVGIVSSCPARPGPRTLGHRASRQCVRARTFASPVASGVRSSRSFGLYNQSIDQPIRSRTIYYLLHVPPRDAPIWTGVKSARWLHGGSDPGLTPAGRKVEQKAPHTYHTPTQSNTPSQRIRTAPAHECEHRRAHDRRRARAVRTRPGRTGGRKLVRPHTAPGQCEIFLRSANALGTWCVGPSYGPWRLLR